MEGERNGKRKGGNGVTSQNRTTEAIRRPPILHFIAKPAGKARQRSSIAKEIW